MLRKNTNLIILFFTMVVVMIGFGIIIPIMPFYVESFGASGSALGMLMATFSVMQFIFSPIWGSLSDRIGRKPLLVIGALGFAISNLLFGFSTQLWMLMVSRALGGILSSATIPTALAFIGDSTSEEERGGGMGLVGAAMGVGMVLGPGIGGIMAGHSLSLPFFFAAGMSFLATILIMIILPESLPPDRRDLSVHTRGPQLSMMWKALFGPMGFLFFLFFLVSFGLTSFEAIFGLFAQYRFNFGPDKVGVLLTVVGGISAILQGVLSGPLIRRWSEETVIKVSLFGSAIGFLLMLVAFNYITSLLTVGFYATANALLRPSISSLISKRADIGQGIAMGLGNSYQSVGRIVGPLWAGMLIDVNVSYPYLSGSVIMLLSFFPSLFMLNHKERPKETADQTIAH